MWMRAIVGAALCVIGGLWFAQGIGVAKGSPMTGHSQWAWIGGFGVLIGAGLIAWAILARKHTDL